MKRVIWNVLAGAFIAAALTACGGGSGSSGGGKSAKIKMTTEKGGNFEIGLGGSGVATVDWGDGSEQVSLTLKETDDPRYGVYFKHTYPSANIRTVTVNGDNLTGLECSDITSLDVSKNKEMTWLNAKGYLESLDVSKNTALTWLILQNTQLASLDVSKNTALTYLSVSGNFTSLDLSKNTALIELWVFGRNLTSLDVSKNTALMTWLNCSGKLSAAALNALFGTLHSNTVPPYISREGYSIKQKRINIRDNPGYDDCDKSIATNKGWEVY